MRNATAGHQSGQPVPRREGIIIDSRSCDNVKWRGHQGRSILRGTSFGRWYGEAGQRHGGFPWFLAQSPSLPNAPPFPWPTTLPSFPTYGTPKASVIPWRTIENLVAAAILCGMRSLQAIAQCGRALPKPDAATLGFTHPLTPCKSTLSEVLRQVEAEQLEQPSASDWLRCIRPEPWMGRTPKLEVEETDTASAVDEEQSTAAPDLPIAGSKV